MPAEWLTNFANTLLENLTGGFWQPTTKPSESLYDKEKKADEMFLGSLPTQIKRNKQEKKQESVATAKKKAKAAEAATSTLEQKQSQNAFTKELIHQMLLGPIQTAMKQMTATTGKVYRMTEGQTPFSGAAINATTAATETLTKGAQQFTQDVNKVMNNYQQQYAKENQRANQLANLSYTAIQNALRNFLANASRGRATYQARYQTATEVIPKKISQLKTTTALIAALYGPASMTQQNAKTNKKTTSALMTAAGFTPTYKPNAATTTTKAIAGNKQTYSQST